MSNQPLVSVGIPTYNRSESLKRSISSVINQTYTNLEIIISDNASTDETQQICEEFSKLDSRIKYIRQSENFGAGNNFKFVLEKATGEYFMWLGDDDWLDTDYIESCISFFIHNPNYALVGGRAAYYFEVTKIDHFGRIMTLEHESNTKRVLAYYEQVWDNGIFYSLIRRELIPRTLKDCLGGDWLLIASIIFQGKAKTIENINIHRQARLNDTMEKLAARLGLHPFHGKYPMFSISISAFSDILFNSIYSQINLIARLNLAVKVLSLLWSKYSFPNLKHNLVVKVAQITPKLIYPYIRFLFRTIKYLNSL